MYRREAGKVDEAQAVQIMRIMRCECLGLTWKTFQKRKFRLSYRENDTCLGVRHSKRLGQILIVFNFLVVDI